MKKGHFLNVEDLLDMMMVDENNKGLTYLYTRENKQYTSHYLQDYDGQIVIIRISKFFRSEKL